TTTRTFRHPKGRPGTLLQSRRLLCSRSKQTRVQEFLPNFVRRLAGFDSFLEGDRAVTLGQALAVVTEHQGHMAETAGRPETESVVEPELARGRVEQIGSAEHLADPLVGVIDRDREVISEVPVVPANHEIVERSFDWAADVILETDPGSPGPDPQRRRATVSASFG